MRIRALAGALALCLLAGPVARLEGAKLSSVGVIDKDYLVVHVLDGDVTHNENGTETVTRYTPELDVTAAVQTANWTLKSDQDTAYGTAGRHPLAVSRKKKLSGHAQMAWSGRDYQYQYTYQHWIYLKLPSPLQQGASYTLEIAAATYSDRTSATLTYDIYSSRSEAIHVNLVGYAPDAPHKAADLYQWLGDGGARDYSSFQGNTVYVYDVNGHQSYPIGHVAYWKPDGSDVNGYDLTRSTVWNADFSGFSNSGTYRIAIEGVGCSQDFTIATTAYADAFRVALRGFYYMRVGQQDAAIVPPPRTPLYIPGVSPPNTTVYLTTMQPWHPRWNRFASGDQWDDVDAWAAYKQPGSPTNPNAWGGHADAYDWDRHLGHVSIIYDMLLPYILTGGRISDDDTGITESGNGIPDLLDEARSEVDFWLRLRDGEGYSHGLTNPNSSNVLYQAGATPMAAWANAANAAMLADAFRLAGRSDLMATYRDAAAAAYGYASRLADPMLDATQNIGESTIRARDLKMTAAAFLYKVTGDTAYEDEVNADSVCANGLADLEDGTRNQVWATAGYLTTAPAAIHYTGLFANMKACVIAEAKAKEAGLVDVRPSRRATDDRTGYFRTIQNVQRTMIAHAVTEDPTDRDEFRKALALEADWSLGRNPLNMIEMTTWTTPLASKRSVEYMYTRGRDDGVPGLEPGHTPYLNLDDWYTRMTMGSPSKLYQNGYPADFKGLWPIGEGYFNTPWVWAHSEFTPQQTMRGKTALYAYLYGLGPTLPPTLTLVVTKAGAGSGAVSSSDHGINCGSDCSETYTTAGTTVTLSAVADSGSIFGGWSGGGCSGTGTCTVTVNSAVAVTATFSLVSYPLTVTRTGLGSGTITSDPVGITCGTDCSQAYPAGTSVTLTATPAVGSTFAGWTGGCSGSGACTVAMNSALSVGASFTLNPAARCTYPATADCAWAISASAPTRIEAENYDSGGEGVAYHDTDAVNQPGQYRNEGVDIEATVDAGGGYNVSYIAAGEWLEYTVSVPATGKYNLKLRVSRKTRGTTTVAVQFNGVDKTGTLTVPSTGSWQAWTDVTTTVTLDAGRQPMRVVMVGGNHNLNWIELTPLP